MKIKPYIISGVVLSFAAFGCYLFLFPNQTEYLQAPATSYIDGATPTSPVLHPINP